MGGSSICPELINNQWVRRYDISVDLRRKIIRQYGIQSLVDAPVQFWRLKHGTGLTCFNVVNVDVIMSPVAATGRNFGALLILGTSTVIPVTERIRQYSAIEDIGDDFGADSRNTKQRPSSFHNHQNPRWSISAVGRRRWRKEGGRAVETCYRPLMPAFSIPTGTGWQLPTAPIWLRLT